MKTNAIVRIIIYAVIILLLSTILVTVICADFFSFQGIGETVEGSSYTANVSDVTSLDIDWAAGSITIVTADTDQITVAESGEITEKYTMVCTEKNGKLTVEFTKSNVTVGIGSIPAKDLTITVPRDWTCSELELDAAAVEVNIDGLTVDALSLDGAAAELRFNGSVNYMDIDGASMEMDLVCANRPVKIDIDGASCVLDLTLPEDCGFLVQINGLGCSFSADADYTRGNGDYFYGDRACQICADGLSCQVTIQYTR